VLRVDILCRIAYSLNAELSAGVLRQFNIGKVGTVQVVVVLVLGVMKFRPMTNLGNARDRNFLGRGRKLPYLSGEQ